MEAKANFWKGGTEMASAKWRPMCEVLAREYERLARGRTLKREWENVPVTPR